jgi:hypothetical protein
LVLLPRIESFVVQGHENFFYVQGWPEKESDVYHAIEQALTQ